jgi:hypothetical protein
VRGIRRQRLWTYSELRKEPRGRSSPGFGVIFSNKHATSEIALQGLRQRGELREALSTLESFARKSIRSEIAGSCWHLQSLFRDACASGDIALSRCGLRHFCASSDCGSTAAASKPCNRRRCSASARDGSPKTDAGTGGGGTRRGWHIQ